MKKKRIKKVKQRLPMEVVKILRSRGSVVKSKKDYNRKNEKKIIKNEINLYK